MKKQQNSPLYCFHHLYLLLFGYQVLPDFLRPHGLQHAKLLCPSSFIRLFSSVQFSRSVVSDSLRPHESQHTRPPCPSPTPGVHSDSRNHGFCVAICHLILEHILNKCGYVIHHFNVHFSLYVFFLMTLLTFSYFIFISYLFQTMEMVLDKEQI